MAARYNMNGKILLLPINGNGLARGNFTDIDVIATVQGERYKSQKTGEIHYRVVDFYVDFDVEDANINLDNLFNGDNTLSNAMNPFLNDNWKIVAAESQLSRILLQTFSKHSRIRFTRSFRWTHCYRLKYI